MVFVYMGIAVFVIFLFLVIYYNRKKLFKKREKPVKQKKLMLILTHMSTKARLK